VSFIVIIKIIFCFILCHGITSAKLWFYGCS
jgi:hypothetical protein